MERDALDDGANGLTGSEVTENAALKKRIRELEMENEILERCFAIFGRGS